MLGYTEVAISAALVVGVASLEAAADVVTGCIESMVVTGISADAPEVVGWVEKAVRVSPDEVLGLAVAITS